MTDLELARELKSHTLRHWPVVPEWARDDIASDGSPCLMRRVHNLRLGLDRMTGLPGYHAITEAIFQGRPEDLLDALNRTIARLEEQEAAPYLPSQSDLGPLTRSFYEIHQAKRVPADQEARLRGVASEVASSR